MCFKEPHICRDICALRAEMQYSDTYSEEAAK